MTHPHRERSGVGAPLSTAIPLTPLRCVRGSDKCVKPDRARYITSARGKSRASDKRRSTDQFLIFCAGSSTSLDQLDQPNSSGICWMSPSGTKARICTFSSLLCTCTVSNKLINA